MFLKPTNSGLLLHYHSHVDNTYKRGLLTTMLDRAYRLSSSWSYFTEERERLKSEFCKLQYPKYLMDSTVDSTVKAFLILRVADQSSLQPRSQGLSSYRPLGRARREGLLRSKSTTENTIWVVIPFKDQAPVVRKVDNAIHRINHYPVDSVVCFVNTYPLDSDLSGG